MSGVAAIYYLAANDASLTAQMAAAQIAAGPLKKGTLLPNASIWTVSDVELRTVSMNGAKKMRTERVRVALNAPTYQQKKALLDLVRAACANRAGTVNGVDVMSILPGGVGPDDDDPAMQVFSVDIDFLVQWRSS